jgi:hypothetical protein
MIKQFSVSVALLTTLILGGCASTPQYKYGAMPAQDQDVVVAKSGDAAVPRLVSKHKDILMAEPRAIACDGAAEFAFNVVFANRQDYPVQIAPSNFKVTYAGRIFQAMTEKEVEKDIHHDDWFKNSMMVVGVVGAIAGAAAGDYAGASTLLAQTGSNYGALDAQQNAEFEKYRNKVLASTSVAPKATYGGLVVAKRDEAGKDYTFEKSLVSADIELIVDVDGQTDTLSFNCRGGTLPLPKTADTFRP